MVLAGPKLSADPEARLLLNGPGQLLTMGIDQLRGRGEHAHSHAAGNVHAHAVWDDRIRHGQDPADGQTVTDVGIGHERAAHGHGQAAPVVHLLRGLGVQTLAPGPPARAFRGIGRRRYSGEHRGQTAQNGVIREGRRVLDQPAKQTAQSLAAHPALFQPVHAPANHRQKPLGDPQRLQAKGQSAFDVPSIHGHAMSVSVFKEFSKTISVEAMAETRLDSE